MKIVKRKIKDLIRAEYNPRKITKVQFQDLKDGIVEFGLVEPLVINENPERKNIIVGGHQRLKIWEELGNKEVDCSIVNLPLDKERKLNIKLNKNGGTFDDDLLQEFFEYEELIEWGFTPDELFDQEEKTDGLIDDDEIPEVKESKVKRGDIWQLGEHRVMCGDSTSSDDVEKLMNGEKADMVFTDPPYGVDYDGGHAVKGVRREKLKNDGTPDIYNDTLPIMYMFSKKDTPLYLWYSDSKSLAVLSAVLSAGYKIRNNIIWNKNVAQFGAIGAQYKTKHEPCLYCYKKGQKTNWIGPNNEVSVWDIDRNRKNEYHPTQKPLALAERCIKNHTVKLVLDLFLGSGSTLIAAEKLNRKCYGMELDEKYCDVIINRWEQFTGLKANQING